MQYKKIILTPKSGLITPLESDTVLSYIFAFNFEKLNKIYKKFQNGKDLPFVITSGFNEGGLPKPIYFHNKVDNNTKTSLLEDLKEEINRKKIKKISSLPIKKEFFELLFDGKQNQLKEKIKIYLEEEEKNKKENSDKEKYKIISEYKNTIPRFNIGETNPYIINDIKYSIGNYVIYVKIFNEKEFETFFECLKNTFKTIGFGKGKSRGYGHFKKIIKEDLDENELEVFNYFESLENERNIKIILNNYKPKNDEIKNFNLESSFYKLNNKHTRSLFEFNKNVFKGKMSFISPGSVICFERELIGDFYKSGDSYNFGYIF